MNASFTSIPSAGNFLTVEFGERSSAIYQGLLERGVIVRPVANYDLPRFLRISVGTPAQIEQFFSALDASLMIDKLCIIGVGLIGSSLSLALKRKRRLVK